MWLSSEVKRLLCWGHRHWKCKQEVRYKQYFEVPDPVLLFSPQHKEILDPGIWQMEDIKLCHE